MVKSRVPSFEAIVQEAVTPREKHAKANDDIAKVKRHDMQQQCKAPASKQTARRGESNRSRALSPDAATPTPLPWSDTARM